MKAIHRDTITWLLFMLSVFLSGWFVFMNLSEFVIVGILRQNNGYPFGGEGPVPRYYQTARMYTTVNLVFGLLFLSVLITSCLAFIRSEKKFLALLNAIVLVLIFMEIMMGQAS